jgi:hypothetical protein
MRKIILPASIILALIALLNLSAITTALFNFVFLGAIPGTQTNVPFWVMLPSMVFLGFVVVRWITHQPMYIGNLAEQEKLARQLARKRVAKTIEASRATSKVQSTPAKKQYRAARTIS